MPWFVMNERLQETVMEGMQNQNYDFCTASSNPNEWLDQFSKAVHDHCQTEVIDYSLILKTRPRSVVPVYTWKWQQPSLVEQTTGSATTNVDSDRHVKDIQQQQQQPESSKPSQPRLQEEL